MYFLAGVADAEIFKGKDLFATAKTLIDSSITIGVSAEDIRAGKGAKLYGKYFHTSTFDLKLSDAMFKLEYIAANVGAEIQLGGEVFTMEEIELTAGSHNISELSRKPVPMAANNPIYLYVKKANENTGVFETITVTEGKFNIVEAGKYCVKYLYTNEAARKIEVNANFIPDTLSIYLTANLYSGDVADVGTGTRAGTITIKVPRFLLSGSQEIAMSMTGAANTPLEGSALATKGEGCDGEGIYAEIIEVIESRTLENLVSIMIEGKNDALELEVDESAALSIYGRYQDTVPALLNGSFESLKFTSSAPDIATVEAGVVTAKSTGTATITVYVGEDASKAKASDTIEVTVA